MISNYFKTPIQLCFNFKSFVRLIEMYNNSEKCTFVHSCPVFFQVKLFQNVTLLLLVIRLIRVHKNNYIGFIDLQIDTFLREVNTIVSS